MFCSHHRPPYAPDERARLERWARTILSACEVPGHLRDGLVRWVCDGILPGSFLQAALIEDHALALTRADPVSREGLGNVLLFVAVLPESCRSSRDALLNYTTTPTRIEV